MKVEGNLEQVTITLTQQEAADLYRWGERAGREVSGAPATVAQLRLKLSPYGELAQIRAALTRSRADVLRLEQQQSKLAEFLANNKLPTPESVL